ncbi:hypothetical protein GCM10010193_01510 [Kitasatospora atroaurantiaca]|uniref:Uncharacterized protein n=1 Tax=Kitasatospora atroaurantiaca TaxID=285545 RepID=A0A561EL80_9ACTN|nr:hypothetical protein [Kitasatospora atroaurantiaca]TWE16374.1 hypothetical protein FB465_1355 [Kitasatospora atroaurantiaca]
MRPDERTTRSVRYLLGLLEEPAARRVCHRLRMPFEGEVGPTPSYDWDLTSFLNQQAPGSAVLWMLQEDDPEVNAELYTDALPVGLRRDILEGVSFAPEPAKLAEPVPVSPHLWRSPWDWQQNATDVPVADVLDALYQVGGRKAFRQARAAAARIRNEHWPAVAQAHRDVPLPGFARWTVSVRADCPADLREEFGSHAKFRHRVRQAGIFDGPAEYLAAAAPAAGLHRHGGGAHRRGRHGARAGVRGRTRGRPCGRARAAW